jgi:hypothetical protein
LRAAQARLPVKVVETSDKATEVEGHQGSPEKRIRKTEIQGCFKGDNFAREPPSRLRREGKRHGSDALEGSGGQVPMLPAAGANRRWLAIDF